MTKLLINEPPLQVLPTLAKKIGLNEAIILQQIHYWIINPKVGKIHEGHRWVRNTVDEWRRDNFPFWGENTIRRAIANLEKKGLIFTTSSLNKAKYDKTKWYTINYESLAKVENKNSTTQNGQRVEKDPLPKVGSPTTQNGQSDLPKMGNPIPETPETTTEKSLPSKKFGTDPLSDAMNGKGQTSEATAPNPADQWFQLTEEFVRTFNDRMGRYPRAPEKERITLLAERSNADPGCWKRAIDDAVTHHPHGNPNLERIEKVYLCYLTGGDWNEFAAQEWGDDKEEVPAWRPPGVPEEDLAKYRKKKENAS